jgi:hypothetical protein
VIWKRSAGLFYHRSRSSTPVRNSTAFGGWVLYFDTDGIVYQHDDSQFNNIITNSLGCWTNELSGNHMTRYVSRGPKNYTSETREGKSVCKVKGLTLKYRTSQIVSLATLKHVKRGWRSPCILHPLFLQGTHQHNVRIITLVKKYQLVYDKRQQVHDYNTPPLCY